MASQYVMLVSCTRADGAEIVTVEGLAQNGDLTRSNRPFVENRRGPVWLLAHPVSDGGRKTARRVPTSYTRAIQQSITGNLCRCTGYYKIVEAFTGRAA